MLRDERQAPEHATADEAACSTIASKEDVQPPKAQLKSTGTASSTSQGAQEERRYRVFADLHAKGCAPFFHPCNQDPGTHIIEPRPAMCCLPMLAPCFCRYFITSGSKFGADFLLYLGDPVEQHAVACVRIIDPHMQPSPVMLAGAARSAFGARKDLLLATVDDDDLQAVHYLTLTPEPSAIQV